MRSSVPLGHKLIAVVVAVATACGLYAFLRYREAQLAFAASLSFDSVIAEQLDPGITRAPHPAVVLGQTILSDSVVASLAPQAGPAASSTADAIGEFRTRVELTQPTAGLLWVRYRDPDPAQAAATANTVAKALAGWEPSTTSASLPAANAQPVPAPGPKAAPPSKSAPASGAAPQHAPAGEPSLAAALGELHAQLSAANQRAGPESSLQSERDRQRYLESQVRAAQQKLGDLRSKFADSGSASGAQSGLTAIQRALALFWPSAAGLNTAGTSEAQLDYEREQLTRVIAVLEQRRLAAQREEAANPASANLPSQTAPPASQPQPAAAVSSPSAADATSNPFHLERMAGLPARVVWWLPALIGCFCGLLYWGLAFARYRPSAESDDLLDLPAESARSPHRMITYAPVPADSHGEPVDAYPVKTSSHKRVSSTFDPDPSSAPAPDQSPSPEPVQGMTADTVLECLPETAIDSTHTDSSEITSVVNAVAPLRAPKEQGQVLQGQNVETADTWSDEIRKNLSQTDIARTLEVRIMAEEVAIAKGPARDEGGPPSQADRLTG